MSSKLCNEILAYAIAYDEKVTGSNIHVSVHWPDGYRKNFVVDSGLFFGEQKKYNFKLPYKAEKVDLSFCTHGHVDHSGAFPSLIYKGFCGPIYSSKGTAKIFSNMVGNSSGIILQEYKRFKQRPPFTVDDVRRCIENVESHAKDFFVENEYKGRVFFTFIPNQHIFGSSSILVRLTDPNPDVKDVVLFFSGDYNDRNLFIPEIVLPDNVTQVSPSCMFIESTYGDSKSEDIKYLFEQSLHEFMDKYDTLIINAFAFGRMQDFLFLLKMAQDKDIITDDIDIWIDGSLGISNTFLILKNPETFLIKDSARKFLPKNLNIASKDSRESIALSPNKKIIVTSSGDGSFGPARQYLSWKVSDEKTLILFGGYCTKDSLGYKLIHTPYGECVDMFGYSPIKKATVYNIEEVSAHGRSDVQKNYVRIMQPKSVIVNHGDPEKQEAEKTDIQKTIHPSKGTYVSSRNTVFVINSYGVKKVINNCKLKYF